MANTPIAEVQAAILHEALNRASRVSPTKGAPFDRAGGIKIEFDVDTAHVIATDLEVSFYQKIPLVQTHQIGSIRVPLVVASFVASLPMDKDQVIRFHRNDKSQIVVQYGKTKTKATIKEILGEYPTIPWFEYHSMSEASELSSKIECVAWAVERDATGVLSGIRIDGEWLEGLSSKNAARIRCDVQTDAPVVAVLKAIAPLIKSGSKTRILTTEGKVVVALDETAQVISTTVLGPWPNLVERLEKFDFPSSFTIKKSRVEDALKRVLSFVRNDRMPQVRFSVTATSVDVALDGGSGDIQDSCALSSRSGPDEEINFTFNPSWLLESIETFPGSTLQVDYQDNKNPIRLSEPSTSYEAYVMPMNPTATTGGE